MWPSIYTILFVTFGDLRGGNANLGMNIDMVETKYGVRCLFAVSSVKEFLDFQLDCAIIIEISFFHDTPSNFTYLLRCLFYFLALLLQPLNFMAVIC